eukprot:380636-Pelagomonas_calceolata.AAC.2
MPRTCPAFLSAAAFPSQPLCSTPLHSSNSCEAQASRATDGEEWEHAVRRGAALRGIQGLFRGIQGPAWLMHEEGAGGNDADEESGMVTGNEEEGQAEIYESHEERYAAHHAWHQCNNMHQFNLMLEPKRWERKWDLVKYNH